MAGRQRARNAISPSEKPILSPRLGEEVSQAEDLGDGIIRGALPWLRCDQGVEGGGLGGFKYQLSSTGGPCLISLYINTSTNGGHVTCKDRLV